MKKRCMVLALSLLLAAAAGCGVKEEKTVSVQSVGMILGFENAGTADRFSGIVVSRGETKIQKDADKDVEEILVKAGDEVSEGDVLVTSGMGRYPAGIVIGKISKAGYDSNKQLMVIYVRPAVDFTSLKKVSVIL